MLNHWFFCLSKMGLTPSAAGCWRAKQLPSVQGVPALGHVGAHFTAGATGRDSERWWIRLVAQCCRCLLTVPAKQSNSGRARECMTEATTRTHDCRKRQQNISTTTHIHGWTVCWLSFYLHSPCGPTHAENRLSILVVDASLLFLYSFASPLPERKTIHIRPYPAQGLPAVPI